MTTLTIKTKNSTPFTSAVRKKHAHQLWFF